ncbi:MAG: hypothetical protein J6Q50_02825 [Clostridia bacterium]|nr:hypothetical protein [Clostridia bacterium]
MRKKLNKYDLIFIATMIAGLLMHLACLYSADHFADESLYPTVPLRLINSDSLVSDEWHLTQFVSLFLYIPVRVWMQLKGTTEGIILFLRYFYLVIHTSVSIGIYAFFRKNKLWAVVGAMMFYTQVPLRFLSANYHSLLALFLLFLTIALLTLYKKNNILLYIVAGFFYGCCCVCNPFECMLFGVYIIVCIIWHTKLVKYKRKLSTLSQEDALEITERISLCEKFFGTKAFFKFFIGLCVAATISIAFFFVTGGTLIELLENIPYLLEDKGHDIFNSPIEAFVEKIGLTIKHFNTISLNLPFLLPIFFFVLLNDKKRKNLSHKLCYVIISFSLAIFYTVGVLIGALGNSRCLAISLPFAIISTVCYILTENKNKKLFYCMWLPGLIANVIQYLASDLHLSTMWVLTISNIAGVFFLKDFITEIKLNEKSTKNLRKVCQGLLCVGICLQLVFQCCIYLIGRTVDVNKYIELQRGPYAGLLLKEENYNRNNSIMDDLDIIKSRTNPNDPVLIISEFSWMYLYIDRPFATYSAWQPFVELGRLRTYYRENPQKTPKYVYIGNVFIPTSVSAGHKINQTRAEDFAKEIMQLFNCEREDLSNGILLTVNH